MIDSVQRKNLSGGRKFDTWIVNRVSKKLHMYNLLFLYAALICGVTSADAGVLGTQYYEFAIPWNDDAGIPVQFLKGEDVKPAGRHGRLQEKGERLLFQDGTPARFWGMAISLSSDFPPADRSDAKAVVRKLVKYGFNLVRLNALDYPRNKLYPLWLDTGKLDPVFMDRLDYFVSELRQAGIYYSLSINTAPQKAQSIEGVHMNEHPVKHKKYKYIQLYDERIVNKVLDWHKAVYSHKNSYTGLTYAHDPANVYVTAVGEDSIFNAYFRKNAARLGKENWKLLEKKFGGFLRRQYSSSNDLRREWREKGKGGLEQGENLENGTVVLTSPSDLKGVSAQRKHDIMRFLFEMDLDYVRRVRKALMETGYSGIVAATNDWYGYASMRVNEIGGDVIDMHGYFDLVIKQPRKGKSGKTQMVRNISYIASPADSGRRVARIFGSNLYNFFASAVEGRPLLITEWNHSGWSDYLYEGPLLLTAYSAFQGYPAMVIHTYLSYGLPFKSPYLSKGLAASGNPVLMSLSPTLSLAFTRGYVKESEKLVPITIAANDDELWDATLRDRLDKTNRHSGVPYDAGFIHKIRVRLIGKKSGLEERVAIPDGAWRSDTGQILWDFKDADRALFTIDAPKFQVAAGRLDNARADLSALGVSLTEHGAVTAIALDDKPLTESSSILVTAVSSFKNTGVIKERVGEFGAWRDLVRIIDPGTAPVLMKRVLGRITLRSMRKETPIVSGVMLDGRLVPVRLENVNTQSGKRIVTFPLGSIDTPWYWIRFENKSGATS